MSGFSTFESLFSYIKEQVNNSLGTDVADEAVKVLKEHVIEDVYDQYEPTMYQRTGGLYQDENIEVDMVDSNTLSVRSIRKEDGRDIAQIIETGVGYEWTNSKIYKEQPFPRPFTENAQNELEDKGLARESLKESLIRKGFKVI